MKFETMSVLEAYYSYDQISDVDLIFDGITTPPILDHNEVPQVEGALVTWWPDVDKLASNDETLYISTPSDTADSGNGEDGETLMTDRREIGVLTDVCNNNDLPEVELFSLIEEQIPKYRLRADDITDFRGYENADWVIQTPVIPLDTDIELTTDQIDETLKYFILCSERLTQMTRTYNDIEAVNRLLEEKERDLELAARIGQTLLQKNQVLTDKNENLEEQLTQTTERLRQLKHEVTRKTELLQALTHNDTESSSNESTPCGNPDGLYALGAGQMEVKVKKLEEENIRLRIETAQLSAETSDLEEKEAKLVSDCLEQLGDVKSQLEQYAEELCKKTEECSSQKEEITGLLAQLVDLQHKTKVLALENVELNKQLEASQSSQRKLTCELKDLKDKHDELFELLEENQDELRRLRKKQKPGVAKHSYLSASLLSIPSDSLASELECSWKSESDFPHNSMSADKKVHNWKIFETAKAAKRASYKQEGMTNSSSILTPGLSSFNASNIGSEESSKLPSGGVSCRSSMYFSDAESEPQSEGYNADLDSLYGSTRTVNKLQIGRPGIPGSNDLETALRKLSIRRANELNEMDYFEEEAKRNRHRSGAQESSATPKTCDTPGSTMSTGSLRSGLSPFPGSNSSSYKLPDKLKIVKPLEGSVTLRQWQLLATPHLGGIFEARPGVQIKGERKLDLEEEVYNLSDFEEDDELEEGSMAHGRFQDSSTINTYTNSMVKHPTQLTSDEEESPSDLDTDSTSVSSSMPRLSTMSVSTSTSKGTSTYSMSLGLAALLNERDLFSEEPKGCHSRHNTGDIHNPKRMTSIISDSHYTPSQPLSTSTVSTSSSKQYMVSSKPLSPQGASSGLSGLASDTDEQSNIDENKLIPQKPKSLSGADFQNDSVLNKLKNTGYSWYGLLGKVGHKSSSVTSLPAEFTRVSSVDSPDNSKESLTQIGATPSSHTKSADDLLSVMTTSDTDTTHSGSLMSVLGRRSSGVLGALSSLKDGLF